MFTLFIIWYIIKIKNSMTDKDAKLAFCQYLKDHGFTNIKIINSPVDISAMRDNDTWFYEIKKTSEEAKYFGAATITELEPIVKNQNFRIVIAQAKDSKNESKKFTFYELTLKQFMRWGKPTIPPSKIYFNISFKNTPKDIGDIKSAEKEYFFSESEYSNYKTPQNSKYKAVPFREHHIETLINYRKEMYNECSHLIVRDDCYLPNEKLYYCDLLTKDSLNNDFFIIKETYEHWNEEASIVPNGECPWRRKMECRNCPLWEAK